MFSRPEGGVFEVVGGKRKEIMSSQPDERNDERMEHCRLRELSRLERTEGESCKNIVKLCETHDKLLCFCFRTIGGNHVVVTFHVLFRSI